MTLLIQIYCLPQLKANINVKLFALNLMQWLQQVRNKELSSSHTDLFPTSDVKVMNEIILTYLYHRYHISV